MQFGLQPFCYHDLAMTPENRSTLVNRLVQNGMGMVELHATWVEPRFTGSGISAEAAREKLRAWRVGNPVDHYRMVKKEFDEAGMDKSVAPGDTTPCKTLELAAVEMIAPAAPMAPRRNISLRFNDTLCPPKTEASCLSFKGLMADNPYVHVARFIVPNAQFAAIFTHLQRLEATAACC